MSECIRVDRQRFEETKRQAATFMAKMLEAHERIAALEKDAARLAEAEQELRRLREELADTRAHEHVLVIVGDMLSRRLEWVIDEPTPGLVPEVLDAIKERARPDVEQWLVAIHNAGFKRPEERAALAPAGESAGQGGGRA